MLVTDALTRAARQCSIIAPSSWLSTTDTTYAEIRDDFLVDTVDDILERVDLPSPIGATYTLTTTGVETYALPANFKRLQRDSLAVYDTQYSAGGVPVTTDGEWTELDQEGTSGAQRYYRLSGYAGNWSISFKAEPSSDIVIHYVTDCWMASAGGTPGNALTMPDDVLLLPNRLVESGIVWRWRERKGLPYSDKMGEYEMLMARLINDSRGKRVVNMGPRKQLRWQDQVPAEIPSS